MTLSELKLRAQWSKVTTIVYDRLQCPIKTSFWMHTPNPNLGNATPAHMITNGRYRKLMKWLRAIQREGMDK